MELVPILSTIILVGTIATFILAVAAYILYKIRERKARETQQQTGYLQQEPHVLVAPDHGHQQPVIQQIQQTAPAPASMYQPAPGQQVQRQQLQAPQQGQNPNSLFWEYTDEGFVPVNPQQEQVQQQQAQQAPQQQQSQQDEGYAWL